MKTGLRGSAEVYYSMWSICFLDGKVKKIHVHEGEVKSVRELLKEVEFMRDEIEEWKAK